MFGVVVQPEVGLFFLGVVSVAYLLLVLISLRGTKPLELKLLWLGLLTAIVAVWCVQLAGEPGASVQVRAGPRGEGGQVFVGSEAAGTLGRIALVLILGGIAVSVLSRRDYPSASPNREEARRGNPV
jgi:hypothetical protein